MGIAIMIFVYPHSIQTLLENNFTDKIIETYRDDPDLQNFIDFAQQEVSWDLKKLTRLSEIDIYQCSLLQFAKFPQLFSFERYRIILKKNVLGRFS